MSDRMHDGMQDGVDGGEHWHGLDAPTVRDLHLALARIHRQEDEHAALKAVADGIVDILGFQLVCVNLRDGDEFSLVAVGRDPEDMRSLLGQRSPVSTWDSLMSHSDRWGGLYFCRDVRPHVDAEFAYRDVPGVPAIGTHDTWGAMNMLMAPMARDDGQLIGLVTADDLAGRRLPDDVRLTALEMFTAQAGIAIDKLQLSRRLGAEHTLLRASEERFRLMFHEAPTGMVMIDTSTDSGDIISVNAAMSSLFGRDRPAFVGVGVVELTPEDHREQIVEAIRLLRSGITERRVYELPYRRLDGSHFWGQVHLARLPTRDDEPTKALGQLVDITAAMETRRTLTHQARHDPLTGLLNRTALLERLDQVVEESRRTGRTGAVLFCDINQFKLVNDRHGHMIGDQVLATVAQRIDGAVRTGDALGRLGGDEFVVVAHPVSLLEANEVAHRIALALDSPIYIGQVESKVSVSIGVVLTTGAVGASEVLRRADSAMYRGKAASADHYVVDTA